MRRLQKSGFATVEARDGSEAIHIYSERAGEITAVTLDLAMPNTNGRETLAMLSEFAPNLPILIVSSTELDEPIGRRPGTRGVGFVQKPFTPEELVAALRRVIDEERGGPS